MLISVFFFLKNNTGLMPLIVNVLESLDLQLIETQQLQVELELMKDDNDQLISAFEKEKQIKKKLEQQLFEYEFHSDEDKQKLNQKINSLESIVKMMEMKSKNANDSGEFIKLGIHVIFNDLIRAFAFQSFVLRMRRMN